MNIEVKPPLCSSIWHQIGGTDWVEKYNDGKHGLRILCNFVGDLQKESKRIFSFIVQVFCQILNFFPIVVTQRLLSFYLYFPGSFDTSLIVRLWYVKNPDTVTAVCQHTVSWPVVFHLNATRRSGPTSKRPYLTYTQWYFCILRQTVSVTYSFIKVDRDSHRFVLRPSQWQIIHFHLVIVVSWFQPSSVKSDRTIIFFETSAFRTRSVMGTASWSGTCILFDDTPKVNNHHKRRSERNPNVKGKRKFFWK